MARGVTVAERSMIKERESGPEYSEVVWTHGENRGSKTNHLNTQREVSETRGSRKPERRKNEGVRKHRGPEVLQQEESER